VKVHAETAEAVETDFDPRDEAALEAALDPDRIPRHVAIIMDGNGRWAAQRGLPRIVGHRAGSESVRAVIEACEPEGVLPIRELTLYTFSAENWRRPELEVHALMELIDENMRREVEELHRKDVRVRWLGSRRDVPEALVRTMESAEAMTAGNERLILNLAINYGGRAEIVDAAASIARAALAGELTPGEITEETFARHLYLGGLSDPDLLIRTAGELRVSNYLLWQIAYSEIWVTPILWPDFRRRHLLAAIVDYQRRQRKFGATAG
jgi:undecaprenyl diphosphate synthase